MDHRAGLGISRSTSALVFSPAFTATVTDLLIPAAEAVITASPSRSALIS